MEYYLSLPQQVADNYNMLKEKMALTFSQCYFQAKVSEKAQKFHQCQDESVENFPVVNKKDANAVIKDSGHQVHQELGVDNTDDLGADESGQGCVEEFHIVRSNQSGDTVEDFMSRVRSRIRHSRR